MRVLITGAGGFVGKHLISELLKYGHEIIAFDATFSSAIKGVSRQVTGDLLDANRMDDLVSSTKPDSCVHLAAMSFAPAAKDKAPKMFSINVVGTLRLLETFRKHASEARILNVSTAHVYGGIKTPLPIKEDMPLVPVSLYAISKAAADEATLEYARMHKMHAMTARPNNHIGPGQSPQFVIASFAQQLKKMSASGGKGTIRAGNMESIRDFTDVRDVVTAYRLLIENGKSGTAYNISSNRMLSIRNAFEELCQIAKVQPVVVTDKELFRPTDSSPVLDITRIHGDTGWTPNIPLSQTFEDILAEF
ncbi:MAG: hypothetical protein A2283_09755 [Lentisphaerae bacterium RIFOXYA12_FULL_48_11]|nr:MAG: hypothetical protein A2283_09755 [Lentisphaerae bacterium RIFOXYA12_FULL_48_11]